MIMATYTKICNLKVFRKVIGGKDTFEKEILLSRLVYVLSYICNRLLIKAANNSDQEFLSHLGNVIDLYRDTKGSPRVAELDATKCANLFKMNVESVGSQKAWELDLSPPIGISTAASFFALQYKMGKSIKSLEKKIGKGDIHPRKQGSE